MGKVGDWFVYDGGHFATLQDDPYNNTEFKPFPEQRDLLANTANNTSMQRWSPPLQLRGRRSPTQCQWVKGHEYTVVQNPLLRVGARKAAPAGGRRHPADTSCLSRQLFDELAAEAGAGADADVDTLLGTGPPPQHTMRDGTDPMTRSVYRQNEAFVLERHTLREPQGSDIVQLPCIFGPDRRPDLLGQQQQQQQQQHDAAGGAGKRRQAVRRKRAAATAAAVDSYIGRFAGVNQGSPTRGSPGSPTPVQPLAKKPPAAAAVPLGITQVHAGDVLLGATGGRVSPARDGNRQPSGASAARRRQQQQQQQQPSSGKGDARATAIAPVAAQQETGATSSAARPLADDLHCRQQAQWRSSQKSAQLEPLIETLVKFASDGKTSAPSDIYYGKGLLQSPPAPPPPSPQPFSN
eukprot:SAG22_NODE_2157_length_2918_cov_4.251153_2_plen_408_part_00